MLIGHLAVSALEHRYAKAEFVPVMAAAVVPDLVDKSAHYLLGAAEFGRLWGHTLLAALISTAILLLLFGRRSAVSWMLGYVSHLLCDLGGVVPWLYPVVDYAFPEAESFGTTLWMGLTQPRMLLEIALVIWAYLSLKAQVAAEIGRLQTKIVERWRDRQRKPLNP